MSFLSPKFIAPVGQVFAGRYRLQYTPTFVLFDAAGIELWRTVGAVDPQQVRRSLATP
jgi:thioredoxin-related protein